MKKEDVKKVAMLSRIAVPENRLEGLAEELSRIIDWVSELEQVNTEKVEPLYAPSGQQLELAKDEPVPQSKQDVLRNAPNENSGFFMVPKVLGEK